MKSYDKYRAIAATRQRKILTLTLNRPEALNAVNAELHTELSDIFYDVQSDNDADVVVLTGAGRAFCAGGDINWMQSSIDRPEEFERTAVEAKRIIYSQLDLEKPLICRMNGHATGLGATIALFCDMVIATERAKIGDPHVSVGLVAGDGGALIWPQLVGYARAKQYLLTGDLMTATEAERTGLINQVVADDALDSTVYALADRLAKGATKAIRWTKVTTNLALKQVVHACFESGIAYEVLSNLTSDHQEGVNAFREKRAPNYTGT
jgi:enoyl-CoA hydratase